MNRKSIVASVILCFCVACVSPEAATQQDESYTISLPQNSQVVKVTDKDVPPIFSFLLESDLAVIATAGKVSAIGLKVKRIPLETSNRIVDMSDWMKGSVNSFQIEQLLFDKDAFLASEPLSSSTVRTFETFKHFEDRKYGFLEYHRYLLFLKRISMEDEIFRKLDLDSSKTYYRVYEGETTLFPVSGPLGHGTYNVGMIDLNTGKHSALVDTIKQLSEALSPASDEERIANLKRLTRSSNEDLRKNAEYAIEYLEELDRVTKKG